MNEDSYMPSMKKIMSDKRILLVEDDFIFAEIIQEVLTEAGFIVQYAEDGQQLRAL